eukprot:TRINITY_DN2521_c0_g1_i3.p1 TRINITY_DN2521_c0_g1~~TRINITY_DN2521_c0_g1_i3.p1  ORF type:complete len:146 (+),score=45.29 TRINITY_DN2521_c0_g1_i3:122-559(+)
MGREEKKKKKRSGYFKEVLEKDPKCKEISLDRDPQFFGPLLAFLRKGRFSIEMEELDGASKLQLFEDIMFFKIQELQSIILDDIKVEKRKDLEKQFENVKIAPPVEESVSAGDPIVQPNGQGCFLCGTMAHAEKDCKFNPENKAG